MQNKVFKCDSYYQLYKNRFSKMHAWVQNHWSHILTDECTFMLQGWWFWSRRSFAKCRGLRPSHWPLAWCGTFEQPTLQLRHWGEIRTSNEDSAETRVFIGRIYWTCFIWVTVLWFWCSRCWTISCLLSEGLGNLCSEPALVWSITTGGQKNGNIHITLHDVMPTNELWSNFAKKKKSS